MANLELRLTSTALGLTSVVAAGDYVMKDNIPFIQANRQSLNWNTAKDLLYVIKRGITTDIIDSTKGIKSPVKIPASVTSALVEIKNATSPDATKIADYAAESGKKFLDWQYNIIPLRSAEYISIAAGILALITYYISRD